LLLVKNCTEILTFLSLVDQTHALSKEQIKLSPLDSIPYNQTKKLGDKF
jgi:hypothetical protein